MSKGETLLTLLVGVIVLEFFWYDDPKGSAIDTMLEFGVLIIWIHLKPDRVFGMLFWQGTILGSIRL